MSEISKYKYIGKDLSGNDRNDIIVKNGDFVEGIPYNKTMLDNTIVNGIDFKNGKGEVFIPLKRLEFVGNVSGISRKFTEYFTVKNLVIGASLVVVAFLIFKK